jgi:threonine/serine exporter ThrE
MADTKDIYKTLDLALRIGELLLSSGAGAADVTAQMDNVARACGLRRVTADVTFTEIAMSHQAHPDEPALIQLRQVRYRQIDYGDLTLVDHLVRDLVPGKIDRAEAATRLNRITSSGHSRPRWSVTLAYGVMGAGVGAVLRGNWLAAAAYAFASYAPYRALLPIAVIAGGATAVELFAYERNIGIAWASALAALVIGVLSFFAANRVHRLERRLAGPRLVGPLTVRAIRARTRRHRRPPPG